MKAILFIVFVFMSNVAYSRSIVESDLIWIWSPNEEAPKYEGVNSYELVVGFDMKAIYIPLDKEGKRMSAFLDFEYMPSESQGSVFVFYCFLRGHHLITLSLGGWVSSGMKSLFGYEYWLERDGISYKIYNGVPVYFLRLENRV